MENEKVSINVNQDKLSAIDLLIDEGLVANRSAFINEAIDRHIEKNQDKIDDILRKRAETVSPNQWFIGLQSLDKESLSEFKKHGIKLSLKGFGSLYLAKDVDAELIRDSVEFISKKIRVHGTDDQLAALDGILEAKK